MGCVSSSAAGCAGQIEKGLAKGSCVSGEQSWSATLVRSCWGPEMGVVANAMSSFSPGWVSQPERAGSLPERALARTSGWELICLSCCSLGQS